MSTAYVRTGIDSFVDSAAASANYDGGKWIRCLAPGASTKYGDVFLKSPVPRGATVLSASLRLYGVGSAGVSRAVSVQRLSGKWSESQLDYNNQPGVTGAVASLTQTQSADGLEWLFDVTAQLQAIADGASHYGWRVSTTATTEQKFYSLNAADFRPVLHASWAEPPDAPTELSPSGGSAVSTGTPTLSFNFHDVSGLDAMQACQVQIYPTAFIGSEPDFDSGTVLTSDPELDLSGVAFTRTVTITTVSGSRSIAAAAGTFTASDVGSVITGTGMPAGSTLSAVASDTAATLSVSHAATANGSPSVTLVGSYVGISAAAVKYWRVRVQNAAGVWSDWSDAVAFTRVNKATLTIDNPAVSPNNFVNDPTPPIIWHLTGGTQIAFRIIIADDSDPTNPLLDTGRITSAANSYTLPLGSLGLQGALAWVSTITYRLTLRVWDLSTRVATVGDKVHIEAVRTFTFIEDPTPNPVTSLVAVQQPNGQPHVKLTFSRATAPDGFTVERNGGIVEHNIDPATLSTGGTGYAYIDRTAPPAITHTWKVRPRVSGAVGPSPTITFQYLADMVWLCHVDTGKLVPVGSTPDEKSQITYDMPETAGLYRPVNGNSAIRIVQGMDGLEGHIAGRVIGRNGNTADVWAANLLWMKKRPQELYRLTIGNQNLHVTIGNVVIAPPGGGDPLVRAVSFDFWSQDGL